MLANMTAPPLHIASYVFTLRHISCSSNQAEPVRQRTSHPPPLENRREAIQKMASKRPPSYRTTNSHSPSWGPSNSSGSAQFLRYVECPWTRDHAPPPLPDMALGALVLNIHRDMPMIPSFAFIVVYCHPRSLSCDLAQGGRWTTARRLTAMPTLSDATAHLKPCVDTAPAITGIVCPLSAGYMPEPSRTRIAVRSSIEHISTGAMGK